MYVTDDGVFQFILDVSICLNATSVFLERFSSVFRDIFCNVYLTQLALYLTRLKGTLANSEDPDQTPQNAASDQDLHCLHPGFVLNLEISTKHGYNKS